MLDPMIAVLKKYHPILIGLSIGIAFSFIDLAVDLLIEGETITELISEHGTTPLIEDSLLFTFFGLVIGVVYTQKISYAEKLVESEEKYRHMSENSLTGIYMFQHGKFQYVNPKFSELLEYTPPDLLNLDVWDIIHPDDREQVRDIAIKREKGEPVPDQYEARAITKSGKTLWVEIRAALIQNNGSPFVFGNFIDNTSRKEKEETIAKNNATLTLVKKYMEDVLKNNYQIINGYTEHIPDEKTRSVFEKMSIEGTELIENIDVFLSLQQNKKPAITPQHLGRIIRKSTQYVRHHVNKAEMICDGNMDITVNASPFLTRALINILINGLVHGSNAPVRIHTTNDGTFATISIVNHGPPISPEKIKSLKEKDNSPGSGFGLKLTTEIIESSKGTWWIESENTDTPGKASVNRNVNKFNIKIPIKK